VNTYPTLPWEWRPKESIRRPEDARVATNGVRHTRIFGDADRRAIEVVHPRLTRAQYDTWLAFRAANLGQKILYSRTRAGVVETYTATMSAEYEEEFVKPDRFNLIVRMWLEP
jgi:hypothetical protein